MHHLSDKPRCVARKGMEGEQIDPNTRARVDGFMRDFITLRIVSIPPYRGIDGNRKPLGYALETIFVPTGELT